MRTKTKRAKKQRAPRPRRVTPEGAVLNSVMDFLRVHRILCFRMNVYNGPTMSGAWLKVGVKGMADLLAFPHLPYSQQAVPKEKDAWCHIDAIQPTWIECKRKDGRQTMDQQLFQQVVEGEGHLYVVVRDTYELEDFLKRRGIIK